MLIKAMSIQRNQLGFTLIEITVVLVLMAIISAYVIARSVTTDQVDVNFSVKEKASGNLLAGAGFSQSQGILLNASVTQDNFLGTGKRVTVAFNNSDARIGTRVPKAILRVTMIRVLK